MYHSFRNLPLKQKRNRRTSGGVGALTERVIVVQTESYIMLSIVLFTLGAMGVLLRRNAILVFMAIELMLNATNLALVAFARHWANDTGQLFVFFIITVAAAEVAVGLALIVTIFRTKRSINIDELHEMKG